MGKINVLSFAVANLIAAGEVVDRPASVIKELLENAIDSGADRITVEIQNGGVTLMRVTDNGCGMEPDDLPIAIRRHATSKIKEAEDLDGIATLGFRGEALAAIASVSNLRIISKQHGAEYGAMLEARGGDIISLSERGCPDGTSVIVEDLFANVPARRKFLKKDATEAMAVSAAVEKIALSKPEIAFRLIVDGNIKLETAGDGILRNTIYAVFGKDFASRLIPIEGNIDGIGVSGFVGRSDNVKANRNYQNFFINGRYVKSKTAMAAIEQAFSSYLAPEKFPVCVMFIELNPRTVDVNVHPAKLEVKFSNEKPVFEAIYYTVRTALEQNVTRPEMKLGKKNDDFFTTVTAEGYRNMTNAFVPIVDKREESLKKRQMTFDMPERAKGKTVEDHRVQENTQRAHETPHKAPEVTPTTPITTPEKEGGEIKKKVLDALHSEPFDYNGWMPKNPSADTTPEKPIETAKPEIVESAVPSAVTEPQRATVVEQEPPKPAETPKEEAPKQVYYKIIGEAFNSYVLVEVGEKLLVIDKHAAHERILFEQLKEGMKKADSISQILMLPIDVMLTTDEVEQISLYREEIEAVGFTFEVGKHTVSVTSIPVGIEPEAVGDMLAVIADRVKNNTGNVKLTRDLIFEKALYQASCKAAIKAGREYTREHIEWIVSKLMAIPDITFCPHGRPVAMELSKKNLDRQFERT